MKPTKEQKKRRVNSIIDEYLLKFRDTHSREFIEGFCDFLNNLTIDESRSGIVYANNPYRETDLIKADAFDYGYFKAIQIYYRVEI
jgi:hypothetical protein